MTSQQRLQNSGPILVAAIDFGTTFSGYACSFRHEFEKDPLKIVASQWICGSRSAVSLKTSSCVLFRPSETFDSFGFEAEEKYSDLMIDDIHHDWFYFRRFKMLLYNSKGLNRQTMINDDKGRPMKAMRVFSEAIRYLKDHLLRTCEQRSFGLEPGDIRWVITIPAIWGDAAKQFMRESAEMAGIEGSSLLLALEPEAASLFCKHLPVEKTVKGAGGSITCFRPGSKYLVIDAGGGTVDITLHEVLQDGSLKELLSANGGPWGGTAIDDAFKGLLADIGGEGVVSTFQNKQPVDYMDLMQEFEVKKRSINPELANKITFKIPISFHEEYSETTGGELRQAVRERQDYAGKLTLAGDKLRAEPNTVKRLFKKTCDEILTHVRNVLAEPVAKGTESILMVGGFSESPMLQEAIQQCFADKKVIIPNDAGLAVLKGAVIFGHMPKVMTSRVCRYSYGIKMYREFVEGVDAEERRYVKSGVSKCRGHFYKLAEVGQSMSIDDEMPGIDCQPASREHSAVTLKVFASPEKNPRFFDDPGCIPLGEVEVQCRDRFGRPTPVFVRLVFGGTELEIRATATSSGETTSAKFDLLR